MDYKHASREELIERIDALEALNRELLKEKQQETKLEYAWTGNLGHWYWNVKTNEVMFNPLKVTTLGYNKSEMPEQVNYQFFTDKLHPEDYEKTMDAMREHLAGRADVYEVEYRIQTKAGTYKWYYDRGKITQYDDEGNPSFLAGIVFDITEKKETQLELEYKNRILLEMSSMDGLTKISNHRTLIEHLKDRMADASRNGEALSIALFDLDDFKKVNDTKGHVYGDRVLIEVAQIILQNIRDNDLAGRYGGEEFLVIFKNADSLAASMTAERIRKTVENHRFADGIQITISGGVKQYMGEELVDFIHEADKNMYQAKKKGKNQIIS